MKVRRVEPMARASTQLEYSKKRKNENSGQSSKIVNKKKKR